MINKSNSKKMVNEYEMKGILTFNISVFVPHLQSAAGHHNQALGGRRFQFFSSSGYQSFDLFSKDKEEE